MLTILPMKLKISLKVSIAHNDTSGESVPCFVELQLSLLSVLTLEVHLHDTSKNFAEIISQMIHNSQIHKNLDLFNLSAIRYY